MMKKTLVVACVVAGGYLLAGCERSGSTPTAGSSKPLPPDLILDQPPADAVDIVAAKEKAAEGDSVVIRGRIGGRVKPFVENRGIFVLVDSSLPTCAENPDDACKTPWDYCCEPSDRIAARSVTVQVAGPDGKPLQSSIEGQGGLRPMARIIVRGEVTQKPDDKTMIVRASGIYVEPESQPGRS